MTVEKRSQPQKAKKPVPKFISPPSKPVVIQPDLMPLPMLLHQTSLNSDSISSEDANRLQRTVGNRAIGHSAQLSRPSSQNLSQTSFNSILNSATNITALQRKEAMPGPEIRPLSTTSPLIQRAPGDPATKAQYRAALLFLLRRKIQGMVEGSLKTYFSKTVKEKREGLGKQWEAALIAKLKNEAHLCFQNLEAGFEAVINDAMENVDWLFQHGHNTYKEEDLVPIENMKKEVVQFLESYLNLDLIDVVAATNAVQERLDAHMSTAGNIMKFMPLSLKPIGLACQRLTQILTEHDPVCKFITDTLKMNTLCQTIIDQKGKAVKVLEDHTEEKVKGAVEKTITEHGHEQNIFVLINQQLDGFEEVCRTTFIQYRRLISRFSKENQEAILQACTNATRLANLQAMLAFYGPVCYDALLQQPLLVRQSCLSVWSTDAIRTALTAKAPAGTNLSVLSQFLAIVGSGMKSVDILQKINAGGIEQIALPGGIAAQGWQIINGCFFPSAFSTGNLATDMVCMKHAIEELGVNPSKGKQEAYFAELVAACKEAKAILSAAKNTDELECNIPQAVGKWRIVIKRLGKDFEVFHIDSGYAKGSPWVKK